MPDNKKILNVPNLRFSEFKNEWFSFKLSQLAKIYDGTHQTPDYKNEGVQFVSVEDIKDLKTSTKFISELDYKRDFKVHPELNDILMTRIGDIGTPAVVNFDRPLGYYVSLALLKPININSYFLSYLIQTRKVQKELWNRTIHVAFPKKINKEEIGECKANIPSFDEQTKISNFLFKIDERIDAQNKIIEDLMTYKNSLIDEYFKKCKNSVSLKNVLVERKIYSKKGINYEHVTLAKEGIIPKGERYDRDFLVKDDTKEYKITKLNDICYNPANLKFGVICLNKYGDSIFSPIYVTFEVNKNYNPYYVSLYLTSNNFINYILRYQQGTVYERMAVVPKDFVKGRLPVSENDNRITKLIKALDSKIKLESQLLEKYKFQKTFLLSNLFI